MLEAPAQTAALPGSGFEKHLKPKAGTAAMGFVKGGDNAFEACLLAAAHVGARVGDEVSETE